MTDRQGTFEHDLFSTGYTAWCGRCGFEQRFNTEDCQRALIDGLDAGWVKNQRHGWVCGECKSKPSPEQEAEPCQPTD